MKAVVLHELGEPEKLNVENVAEPEPKEGEVVVQLHAAALNRRDVWIRRGRYANIKLPIILGSDGAGIVTATGNGVNASLVGKEVLINPCLAWGGDERVQDNNFRILGLPDNGTYANYVAVPGENIYEKPGNLSWEEAAAIPLAGLTAYRAVISRADVQSGQTVLITGIGGGVACFALQIARKAGARVFVTSGSDKKIDRARELGAEDGVNYKNDNWRQKLKEISGESGIDVVVDGTGGENFDAILDVAKPGGTIVMYGATLGPSDNVTVRRIFWKQLNIFGTTMGSPSDFEKMLELYSSDTIKPVIDSVMPLADAAKAHHRMEDAEQFGKLVLGIEP